MNGNMSLGKRVTVLEKGGGAGIQKEIADLTEKVDTMETKVNSGHVYSTAERVVGTWIDGKSIYEISYYATNIPASSVTPSILGTISNIDKMINISGVWKWDGDIDEQPIGNRGGSKAWCDVFRQNNEIKAASNSGCTYLTAILQYTKTTDTSTT